VLVNAALLRHVVALQPGQARDAGLRLLEQMDVDEDLEHGLHQVQRNVPDGGCGRGTQPGDATAGQPAEPPARQLVESVLGRSEAPPNVCADVARQSKCSQRIRTTEPVGHGVHGVVRSSRETFRLHPSPTSR
jgi:hypothetical protein